MFRQFKAQKGKAYDKLPKKSINTFDTDKFLVSKKYDGNQIFIVKDGSSIRWFTSDWKEFECKEISDGLLKYPHNFVLIGEMNYNSQGKLGDRTTVQGKITTARVNLTKKLPSGLDPSKVQVKVFDYLAPHTEDTIYEDRISLLNSMAMSFPTQITPVQFSLMSGLRAKEYARTLASEGWEGCMAASPTEIYRVGKRVNYCVKLKQRPTADLLCIGIVEGEGKYEDMIGSLILKDSSGRIVKVGSGLSDLDRLIHMEHKFIRSIIEIEYEQILDTYIQPTFVGIRHDKTECD